MVYKIKLFNTKVWIHNIYFKDKESAERIAKLLCDLYKADKYEIIPESFVICDNVDVYEKYIKDAINKINDYYEKRKY